MWSNLSCKPLCADGLRIHYVLVELELVMYIEVQGQILQHRYSTQHVNTLVDFAIYSWSAVQRNLFRTHMDTIIRDTVAIISDSELLTGTYFLLLIFSHSCHQTYNQHR